MSIVIMTCSVPHISLRIQKENLKDGIEQLLWRLKHWKPEEVEQQVISGGHVNETIRCWNKITPGKDHVVIRVWNEELGDFNFIDREMETKCVKIFSEKGCGPIIHCTFDNGFCTEFYDGKITINDPSEISNGLIRAVATGLALVHATDVSTITNNPKPKIHEEMEQMMNVKSESRWNSVLEEMPTFPSKNEFAKTLKFVETVIKNIGSPVVLCHGDVHLGNILWNFKDINVLFVDCEIAGFNYQAFDIAYHFYSYHYDEVHGKDITPKDEVTFQKLWIRYYLQAWFEATGRKATDVTDRDVEKLYVQAKKTVLLVCLWLTAFSIENCDVKLHELQLLKFGRKAYEHFLAHYNEFINMKMPDETENTKYITTK